MEKIIIFTVIVVVLIFSSIMYVKMIFIWSDVMKKQSERMFKESVEREKFRKLKQS